MSSSSIISHRGRIVDITPDFTTVDIISESACSACHAKSLCTLSESKTKQVVVPTRGWIPFEPGEEVNVQLKATMGLKAVWVAYVVPLFILLAVLLGLHAAGVSELAAGLSAIGAVALYYLVIWLFRKKLQNEYIFNIEKL